MEQAMAGMKEIRGKIKSVQNTRKITKAMEMVAASKMRRAQERMRAARPYADKVRDIAAHMSREPRVSHPFMVSNDGAKTAGIILVTTDKGLCGGMNTNVLRASLQKFKELEGQGKTIEATAIGNKGLGFLNRLRAKVASPRHAAGRHAAPREADRRGQGAARHVLGRQARRGVPGVHALRQHDEAGSRDRATAAAVGRPVRAQGRRGHERRTRRGTTSTSRTRRR
jgi:ATP synthase F1 gamma subunit